MHAAKIVQSITEVLCNKGVDAAATIESFGQTASIRKRQAGHRFGLGDHVKGMLLAQLSSNRPWKPIERNLDRLAQVFGNYDPDFLMAATPVDLADAIKSLKCGNRQIVCQMGALSENIRTMQRIDIENFVVTRPPMEIAGLLSQPGSYKLNYIGFALACEYLRNVGVDFAKPDVHISRIIGPRRLALALAENERDVLEAMTRLAEGSRHSLTYIDNLIWLYCADGYGAICSANPSCGICGLAASCNQDRM